MPPRRIASRCTRRELRGRRARAPTAPPSSSGNPVDDHPAAPHATRARPFLETSLPEPLAIIPKNTRERIQIVLETFEGRISASVWMYFLDGAAWRPSRKRVGIRPQLLRRIIEELERADVLALAQGLVE
jgi:hypothetical protein